MSEQFITLAPRPWFAHANAVVYVDHGCRRTICHITNAEFSRKATEDHARFIAHACNCHADLVAALRDLLGDRPDVQEHNGRFVCLHCGRDYGCSDDAQKACDSDDCPGFIARQMIVRAAAQGGAA